MSASRGVEFTFAVGARYVCTLTLPATAQRGEVTHVAVEWSPRVPRKLSARERTDYERGRDRAFAAWLGADDDDLQGRTDE